jgi:phosphatidylserine/phosphatidylglycerophosphate/cardiolipin synthase-like enzyme
VKAALRRAVLRGVEVRLITSYWFNQAAEGLVGGPNDQNVAELYADVAAAGVEDPCQQLQIRWYSRDGVVPVTGNGPYASHVKYTSVDDEVVIVGTTNMDTASWNFSHELNLAVDDPLVTAEYDRQLFDRDWARAIPVEACR